MKLVGPFGFLGQPVMPYFCSSAFILMLYYFMYLFCVFYNQCVYYISNKTPLNMYVYSIDFVTACLPPLISSTGDNTDDS